MRAWFLLLVAANLAFFVWTQYVSPGSEGADPAPLARQVAPESLKLVPPPRLAAPSGDATAASSLACVEWGSFSTSEAARIATLLEPLNLGSLLTQRRSEETAHWWVYLPPQGSRQAALRKVEELKKLGVQEYFVMQEEGRWRWAVSLGVFRTEEAAKSRLEAVRALKVQGARVGERDTQVTRVWFRVADADATLRNAFKELAQGSPGTEIRDCPAAN